MTRQWHPWLLPIRVRKVFLTCASLVLLAASLQAQSIVTVAGGGTSSQEGLPATSVGLSFVRGLAADRSGNLYFSETDANVVYRVSIADGTISTFAGNGAGTFGGDGDLATRASLKGPHGLVFDDAGNLYIADHDNSRIRRVDAASGKISTFAGTPYEPNRSGNGDNGPATQAVLFAPVGLAWNRGSLYLTDEYYNQNTVRRIDAGGTITTIAGKEGDSGYSGDGKPATEAQFSTPLAVAVDRSGNVYIADSANSRIRRVDAATGIVNTVVGGGSPADGIGDGGPGTAAKLAFPTAIVFDAAGNLLIADAFNHNGLIRKYDPVAKTVAGGSYGRDNSPFALTIDNGQNVFIYDLSNGTIRRIDATSRIITRVAGGGTFIGDGRVAPAAVLLAPQGLAFDARGNLVIADQRHNILRKVAADSGIISSIAGRVNLCCSDGDSPEATNRAIGFPHDVAISPDGLIYFVNGQVTRINADGTLTLVAGGGQPADGVGDNGPATAAAMNALAISFDSAGNLYIADHIYENHQRIRMVDAATKVISTIAGSNTAGYSGDNGPAKDAQLNTPQSVVVDRSGNIFIADSANGAIRRIDRQTRIITTYAGRGTPADGIGDNGAATAASLIPGHMAIDRRNDDLYFADQNLHRVRKIDAKTQIITTIAGRGTSYYDGDFSGDNGRATEAKLSFFGNHLSGVAIDPSGRVFVSDSKNNRVRMINVCGAVGTPTLTAPAAGSTTSTGPTLRWNPASGAARYDVFLDTTSPPARIVATDLSATSFAPANLQPGVRYFWSVLAKGDPFCTPVATAASSVSSFVTSGSCAAGAFDASSPAPGATTNTGTVLLTWQPSPGAASYDVYLGTSTPPPLVASGVTATTFNANVSSGTYSWFVVAHAACDANRTSTTPTRSFQSSVPVTCTSGQLQVSLVSPAAGALNVPASVELVWSANAPVTGYDLYFGASSTPPLLLAGTNRTRQPVDALTPGTKYFWRVVARGPCDSAGVSSAVQSFTTRTCEAPGETTISFAPPSVSAGATYTLVWTVANGLDDQGGYLVERSLSPTFADVESQVTSSTAASFVASSTGTYYHRVRAVPGCNPNAPGPQSPVRSVSVTTAKPNVVFTVVPAAVVAALGERLENRRGTFTLENISTSSLQVIVGRQELGSAPFFSIVDPTATDAAFTTLEPHTPKTFEIRYAGPANDRSASYQGVIFLAATGAGLSVTPYAFVNLKIGGGPAVAPKFFVDGVSAEYASFRGFPGDDDTVRPPRTITITNPGSTPMDLAAEIGPEVWLAPEANWNSTALLPGESRNVKLFTRRSRSLNGSPLPRYTYFTVRTRDGASARLLVQDNDDLPVSAGRTTRLDLATRSFIEPEVVSRNLSGGIVLATRLRLSNVGGESVQTEVIFTPSGADGFDAAAVKRTTVVLPPNDLVTLTDPLQQLFHLSGPAIGSLEVVIPKERLGLILVSSSVIAQGGSGGYVTPTVNRGEGARSRSPHVLAGIASGGGTITSLTLAETSGIDTATVRVAFFDAAGSRKGETTATIARYGSKRFDDISSLMNGAALTGGRVDLTVDAGGGSVVAMAVVGTAAGGATLLSRPVDESAAVSGSAIARAYSHGTPNAVAPVTVTTVIPVISGPVSSGAAARLQTSVSFLAPPSAAASFVATYRSSAGAPAATRTFSVAAGSVNFYADVASELFGLPASSGSVAVQAAPGGKVYAVLQSSSGSAAPKPSSSLPTPTSVSEALTTAAGGGQRTLFQDGLEQSIDPTRGTRWMLVLNEISGNRGVINVRLYEAGNRTSPIVEKNLTIEAWQQRQLDTVFGELGLESADRKKDRTNVQVVVTAIGGAARIGAMAVSVDNQTGDARTFALAPSVGSATPSVSLVAAVAPPPATSATKRRAVKP